MADDELSSKCLDRLEATIVDLVITQASMAAKLDLLLLKMDTLLISQHPLSASSAKPLLAHTLMPTPPPMPTPSPMPIPPPRLALMQQHPAPLSAPLTIVVVHHPDNSKPQMSSPGRREAATHQIGAEFPSRRILPSVLCLSPSVMFIVKVRDKELDHPFLLPFYATIDTPKWLRFSNTNLHSHTSYFPSPILIWDPSSTFEAMV